MATEVLHVRVVLEERVDAPHTQSQEVLLRELRGELRLILRGDAGVNQTVHIEGDAVVTTELSQTVHQLWRGGGNQGQPRVLCAIYTQYHNTCITRRYTCTCTYTDNNNIQIYSHVNMYKT